MTDDEEMSTSSSDDSEALTHPTKSVHKDKLMNESPFFRRCLQSVMKEAKTNTIILPEDSSRAFDHFIDWVYYTKVQDVDEYKKFDEFLQVWIMADKFCMPPWQNRIMDSLVAWWNVKLLRPRSVSWVAENVDESSKLFWSVVDQFARNIATYPEIYKYLYDDEYLRKLLANPTLSTRIFWAVIEGAKGGKMQSPTLEVEKYYVPE